MDFDLIPFISFVLITTFTPGPNNISSASMGILYGYKKTARYLAGITTGFFFLMLLCSWISATLLRVFPVMEGFLRIFGAIYILWLAYHTLKASYSFQDEEQALLGFSNGVLLQLLNPKAIVYGLTIYSTFLSGMLGNPLQLFLITVGLGLVTFSAISTWALLGAAIRIYLNRPRVKQLLNVILSLMLVYTAIDLSGLLKLLS